MCWSFGAEGSFTVPKGYNFCAMRQYQWIEAHPQVMMGKPVFKGTRIPVDLVLEKLAAGETIEQILESHPRLTPEAIQEALLFAAELVRGETVYTLADTK
jgi:uncharacterized protein (DUF433 family)